VAENLLLSSRMKFVLASLALVAATTAHAADRTERATAIFDQSCSLCHVFGKQPGDDAREKHTLDPTQRRWTPEFVRRWLEDPRRVDPQSMCLANQLDPVAKDLLASFLRLQNTPSVRMKTGKAPVVPRRTSVGAAVELKRPPPKREGAR
jgi:hypothetical protein